MKRSYAMKLKERPQIDIAALLRPSREQIERLEDEMLAMPQVSIPVVHRFAPKLYIREITVPAGVVMTGRVHKFEHFSAMISGEMSTLVGDKIERISGYQPFIAPPGIKRVGYTHTPVVWVTCHHNPDDLRDIEQIEAYLCEPMRPQIEHKEVACLS